MEKQKFALMLDEMDFDQPEDRHPIGEPMAGLAGLCRLCRHAETCLFPRVEGLPVRFCEEVDYPPLPEPTRPALPRRPTASPGPEATQDRPLLLGLCSNCDRRHDCLFPKSEGGVWCCEEYI